MSKRLAVVLLGLASLSMACGESEPAPHPGARCRRGGRACFTSNGHADDYSCPSTDPYSDADTYA